MSKVYIEVSTRSGLVELEGEIFGAKVLLKPEMARELGWTLLRASDGADRQMPRVAPRTEYGFCARCRESYEFEHLCLAGRRA